jgi:hypothetical protein
VKHHKTSEEQKRDEEDMTKHERVIKRDARKFIGGL